MPSKKPKQPKVKTLVAPPPPKPRNVEGDGDFPALVAQVQSRFDAIPANKPLFLVSNDGLFDTFIAGLPPHLRAHYTCNCCRSFFNLTTDELEEIGILRGYLKRNKEVSK
jgi:hypothetical protein